ncbi:MutS-related protein [Ekhidna sp. To15]|uniref:MutS-related protein n=1 Tax=Ekhidna sp. To15 TaxID=3395267 RepID=UPI003F528A38
MKVYQDLLASFEEQSQQLSASDRRISLYRFFLAIAVIALGYQYIDSNNSVLLLPIALIALVFILLLRRHQRIRWENNLTKAKIEINKDELSYLDKGELPFENGEEFVDTHHDYSYDLDFFGEHSIYQHLNRTGTVTGARVLANSLLHILPKEKIEQNQQAIIECKDQLFWRQELLSLARLRPDSHESVEDLLNWASKKPARITRFLSIISYLSPAVVFITFGIYLFTPNNLMGNICLLISLFNLGLVGTQFKSIKNELVTTTRIEQILKQYALLLRKIESTTFQSEELNRLQQKLIQVDHKASSSIHQLSLLFGRLEHVQNIFAGPILNGLVLYHLHVLKGLSSWRKKYATHIEDWLQVIGEFEKFCSLANFSHNNPHFTFPEINDNQHISFEELGHPLIQQEKNVTNSIGFQPQSFFILTGSNMSGKSTFLRTLGINMVLAGIGAPVYAKKASVHPLPVLVSMRLSDSLTDSESYFYAEVKRLKYIMDKLEEQPCFVLLDEILRGTNSDDKRNGTIEVIKNMAIRKVIGGIATHDLEVCNVVEQFPDSLTNKRFEVEIINNELVFDYKLRAGICENKSASFIMKKMGVI